MCCKKTTCDERINIRDEATSDNTSESESERTTYGYEIDQKQTHDRPIAIDLHIAYMHAREGASSPPPSVVVGTARTRNVTFARSSVAVAEIGRGEDLRRSRQTM